MLPGNPPDAASVLPSVAHHCVQFGHPPALLTGDRGTYSPDNEAAARAYEKWLRDVRSPSATYRPETLLDSDGRLQKDIFQRLQSERDDKRIILSE